MVLYSNDKAVLILCSFLFVTCRLIQEYFVHLNIFLIMLGGSGDRKSSVWYAIFDFMFIYYIVNSK